MIERLRELQVKQYIREEGPKRHQGKAGTPTMGGVLIVAAIVIPTLLWADLRNPYVLLALGATLGLRRHRIRGRLQQSRAAAESGADGAREISRCRC